MERSYFPYHLPFPALHFSLLFSFHHPLSSPSLAPSPIPPYPFSSISTTTPLPLPSPTQPPFPPSSTFLPSLLLEAVVGGPPPENV